MKMRIDKERIERNQLKNLLITPERPINIQEVISITGYCRGHIYYLIRNKSLPHYKPTGGRIFFFASEIHDFIKRSRVATSEEIHTKVEEIINGHRR